MTPDTATPIETLFAKADDYSKTTIELLQLTAISKSAQAISLLVAKLVIAAVVVLFAIAINIGVAIWLGDLLGKVYYGFFIVAGFYALITILLIIFSKSLLIKPVSNAVITMLLKQKMG
jgi:hypothetical protein